MVMDENLNFNVQQNINVSKDCMKTLPQGRNQVLTKLKFFYNPPKLVSTKIDESTPIDLNFNKPETHCRSTNNFSNLSYKCCLGLF